ncbi:hypothetical protein V8C35DRAFT_332661 [Trichoderma chlorosporum]
MSDPPGQPKGPETAKVPETVKGPEAAKLPETGGKCDSFMIGAYFDRIENYFTDKELKLGTRYRYCYTGDDGKVYVIEVIDTPMMQAIWAWNRRVEDFDSSEITMIQKVDQTEESKALKELWFDHWKFISSAYDIKKRRIKLPHSPHNHFNDVVACAGMSNEKKKIKKLEFYIGGHRH